MNFLQYTVYQFFNILMLIMLFGVLMSWIPGISYSNSAARFIRNFTESIFLPFRKIIPPIGMLDVSPILAFIVIGLVQKFLIAILAF